MPNAIRSVDDLRARLSQLQSDNLLDATSIKDAFAEAKSNNVRLAPEQLKELYATYGSAAAKREEAAARTFIGAAIGTLGDAPTGGMPVQRAILDMVAGSDKILQKNEVSAAVDVVRDYFIGTGVAPDEAATRARHTILGELGARAGGQTLHEVDGDQIVELAEGFGNPMAVHSRNYEQFIGTRALRESRGALHKFVQALDPKDPVLEDGIENAKSFDGMVQLLQDAGKLEDGVKHLAAGAKEPFAEVFQAIATKDTAAMAADLRKLDYIEVVVVDANADKHLDGEDIVAIHIGDFATIKAIDPAMGDTLRVAEAMQKTGFDLSDRTYHQSKFTFFGFPPKFDKDFFELSGNSMKLKDGVKASDGIKQFINNPDAYRFECATAIVLFWHVTQYHLCQEKYGAEGDAKFDEKFAQMRIGPWDHGREITYDKIRIDPETDTAMAGEWRYFRTWDADAVGKWRGWQGENVIYLGKATDNSWNYKAGDDLYWGHPFGIANDQHIIDALNEQRFNVRIDAKPKLETVIPKVSGEIQRLNDAAAAATDPKLKAELGQKAARLGEWESTLTSLVERCEDSGKQRSELNSYLSTNREKLNQGKNAMVDAQIAHGEHSDEAKAAKEKYTELVTPINEGDEKIDKLDQESWRMGESVMTRAEMAIKEARSDLPPGTNSGELDLLAAVFEAAKALRPRDASLETSGIQLTPIA